ncbi:unnamed protein product, partial [Polarella glacialis]
MEPWQEGSGSPRSRGLATLEQGHSDEADDTTLLLKPDASGLGQALQKRNPVMTRGLGAAPVSQSSGRAGSLAIRIGLGVAGATALVFGAGVSPGPISPQEVPTSALSDGIVSQFSMLTAWKAFLNRNPFRFECPVPFFEQLALVGVAGKKVMREDCCSQYESSSMMWPYQYPECGQKSCSSCWRASSDAQLSQSPVRDLVGLGYAAALAVTGPVELDQKGLGNTSSSRRLGTRHAGLPFKQIIAPVKYGVRTHDVDVCPNIGDWEQYFMNDDIENVHARVYKSPSARIAIVSFRGTQSGSVNNWLIDADIQVRKMELGPPGPDSPFAPLVANVHDGFYTELQRVLPHVRKWVEGYIEGTHGVFGVPPDWKLIFTGHSLGAALATLAATMAEVEGWTRKPDAVVAFGSPRLADKALSDWWESKGLCSKLVRVAVYNDAVTWMPFMESFQVMDTMMSCVQNLASCMEQIATGPKNVNMSSRWAHVCPSSEYLVPGAMKGVNKEMEDYSTFGGVLSHFMGNALFGYGHGVLNSAIPRYDSHCGLRPSIFPSFSCNATEELTSVVCLGLEHDKDVKSVQECRARCCDDPACGIWQVLKSQE